MSIESIVFFKELMNEFFKAYHSDLKEYEMFLVDSYWQLDAMSRDTESMTGEIDFDAIPDATVKYIDEMLSLFDMPMVLSEAKLLDLNSLYERLQISPDYLQSLEKTKIFEIYKALHNESVIRELPNERRYYIQGAILDLMPASEKSGILKVVELYLERFDGICRKANMSGLNDLFITFSAKDGTCDVTKLLDTKYSFYSFAKALLPKRMYECLLSHPESKFNPKESKDGDYISDVESELRRRLYLTAMFCKLLFVDMMEALKAKDFYEIASELINQIVIGTGIRMTSPENINNQISFLAKELGLPNKK